MSARKIEPKTLKTIRVAKSIVLLAAATISFGDYGSATAGTPRRPPWTGSKIAGRPEPPPKFRTVRAFPNVKFANPLAFATPPGEDRIYIVEQGAKIHSFPQRADAAAALAIDLTKEVQTVKRTPHAKDVEAAYGLAFHPRFAENRKCYVCYTLRDERPGKQLEDGSRVSEFTVTKADPPRIDPASERVVLTFLQGGHNGGDLHFGPDGMLYITTGDAANPNPPDPLATGQDCSDFLSSILRVDVDRNDPGKEYSVPPDNPFPKTPNVRPEIWAFGFRNPWRMSFDRATGDLWVGDVGWELWEMVYRIKRGGNYGWAIVEGRQPVLPDAKRGPGPILPPTIELSHSIAASVTGGYVYRGKRFPELAGKYIFGDWETRRIWAAEFDNDRVTKYSEIVDPALRIVAFGQDHAGELYVVDYDDGTIHSFERNEATAANAEFPRRLSDTGLFGSVAKHELAAGVEPFAIAAEQWRDGAQAERFVALPGSTTAIWHAKDVQLAGSMFQRRIEFPKDGVLGMTLSLELRAGDPTSKRRLETQILHFDGKQWRGYTYVWNAKQDDADLAPADGAVLRLTLAPTAGQTEARKFEWPIFGRNQCMLCHNAWAQNTLAFNLPQLNREVPGGNELARLCALGVLERRAENGSAAGAPDRAALAATESLANPADARQPVDRRARAYLHANCAHCHRFGGGGSVDLQLPFNVDMKETKTLDVRPRQGTFGLKDGCILAPGEPDRSVLLYRASKFGPGRMPHVGSELVDEVGVALLREWIAGLDAKRHAISLLENAATAMTLARRLAKGELPADVRTAVLDAAHAKPAEIRDLFEGFQPAARRQARVGTNPNLDMLLARRGDAARGRDLFWNREALQCRNCHRVGGEGSTLGPELTVIAAKRTRRELLESLLKPSAKIEPAYTQYVLQAADGRSSTGLLVKRDANEVVLRDAKNVEVRFVAKDVEKLQALPTSIMPENQVRDLGEQEAADLLEYLSGLK